MFGVPTHPGIPWLLVTSGKKVMTAVQLAKTVTFPLMPFICQSSGQNTDVLTDTKMLGNEWDGE